MADGGEDGVGGIAGAVFEIAAAEVKQPDWDGVIVVFLTSVTIGLIALYVFGKITSRWWRFGRYKEIPYCAALAAKSLAT